MENKTTKFIFKMLIFFPIGSAIWILVNGFENFHWFFSTLIGFLFAFGIVFWNLFDYEKFNGIELNDFLESSHNLSIENSNENWNRIIDLTEQSIMKLKTLEKSKTILKIEIPRKIFDSIFIAERSKNEITLKIEKKGILKFLPDNAENYRTLQKIGKELKTTANTVYKT